MRKVPSQVTLSVLIGSILSSWIVSFAPSMAFAPTVPTYSSLPPPRVLNLPRDSLGSNRIEFQGCHHKSLVVLELGFIDRVVDSIQFRLTDMYHRFYREVASALPEWLRKPAKKIYTWIEKRLIATIVKDFDKVGIVRLDGATYSSADYDKVAVAGDNADERTILAQRNGFVALYLRPEGLTFDVCKKGLFSNGTVAEGRVRVSGPPRDHFFIKCRVPKVERQVRNPSRTETWYNETTGEEIVDYIYTSDKILENLRNVIKEMAVDLDCQAITSTCGFYDQFQDICVDAVSQAQSKIPVLMSSLSLLPMTASAVKGKIMILTANSVSFNEKFKALVDPSVPPDRLEVVGLQDVPGFGAAVDAGTTVVAIEAEQNIVEIVRKTLQEHPDIEAILSECAELPGYTNKLRSEFGLPVVDALTVCNGIMQSKMPRRGLRDDAHNVGAFDVTVPIQ